MLIVLCLFNSISDNRRMNRNPLPNEAPFSFGHDLMGTGTETPNQKGELMFVPWKASISTFN